MNKKWYIGLEAILIAFTLTIIGCGSNENNNDNTAMARACIPLNIVGEDTFAYTSRGVYNHPITGTTGSDVFLSATADFKDIPVLEDGPNVDNFSPSLSSDGRQILTSRRFKATDGSENWTNYSIWMLELGYNGELTQLSTPPTEFNDFYPTISKTSGYEAIFFVRTGKNVSEILELNLKTQQISTLHQEQQAGLVLVGVNWLGDVLYHISNRDVEGRLSRKLFSLNKQSGETTDITDLCEVN